VILLTGFEPFEGQTENASWSAVQQVAAGWDGEPLEIRELPVSFVVPPRDAEELQATQGGVPSPTPFSPTT